MKRFVLMIFIVPLFVSCIGIDSQVILHENGSGEISLHYKISNMVVDMGKVDRDDPFVPLPVTREDFSRVISQVEGVSLLSYAEKSDEFNKTITARLSFTSIETLNRFYGTSDAVFSLSSDGSMHTFRQNIFKGLPEGKIDADSQKLLEAAFKDYTLSFSVRTPRPIRNTNAGTLSQDKMTAVYTTSVIDLFREGKPVNWEISW